MRIRRGAAAEEAEGLGGRDLVPGAGRNENGITWADGSCFAIDLHGALAFEDEVKLLTELVVMTFGGLADGNRGLCEALVLHGRVGAVEDAADGAAVLGGEGFLRGKLVDDHVWTVLLLALLMANGFPLENCRAVITGASSGLGAEFARQLAPLADTLVLVARRVEALEEVKQGLAGQRARVLCCVADLATDAGREAVVAFLDANDLKPNLLVNNAGMGDYGSFASATAEKTRMQIDLNITALTMLTHALIPRLERPGGVLNVSSLAGTLPMPNLAVYAASKSYVTSFSEALAVELAPQNITVTCVCPGPTPTNFSKTARRTDGQDTNREGQGLLRIPPAQVVGEALRTLREGSACVYPGFGVAIGSRVFRMLPRRIMRMLLRRRHAKE